MTMLWRRSIRVAAIVLMAAQSIWASVVLMDSQLADAEVIAPTAQLSEITRMAWAPDASHRLFVARKTGQVSIVKDGVVNSALFATMSPITTANEGGLLGLVFDPQFLTNHYVYFMHQTIASEQRIVRYDASGDVGTNPTVIIDHLPCNNGERNGGSLAFGPDGNLYWSIGNLGDGSSNSGLGLDLTYLASKISRVHPDGTPVRSNPFYDGSGQNRDFIFARGFTSPFMMTFQPATGTLLVCDVGDFYEQFFHVGVGDYAGDNAHENRQTAGMLSPFIAYHKLGLGTESLTIASISRTGGITTITTTAPHWQHVGAQIAISGIPDGSFNTDPLFVSSVPSANTLTVEQAGPDATPTAPDTSRVTVKSFGNCTTGAVFWDSSAVPAAYRGNLIYGDYSSGNMVRVIFDDLQQVSRITLLATGSTRHVTMAQGPDGALYYAAYTSTGTIRRLSYVSSTPALAVSPMHLNLGQGSQALVQVSLTAQPPHDVTVHAVVSGDANITVASGDTLTFTVDNFATPQVITVAAAVGSTSTSTAVLNLSGTDGTGNEQVAVAATRSAQELILSTSSLVFNEGTSGTFTARLESAPSSALDVAVGITSGGSPSITVSPSTLTFDSTNFATPQVVTVSAATDPALTDDTATVALTASGISPASVAVTATNTTPTPGTIVITSTPVTSAVVGAIYHYQVAATGSPAPTFSLTTMPSGMTIDATSGLISWTPTAVATAPVTVVAHNGVDADATQSYSISVAASGSGSGNKTSHIHCGNGMLAAITVLLLFGCTLRRLLRADPLIDKHE